MALYNIDLPLFHVITRASSAISLEIMVLEGNGMEMAPSTPSCYGIHMVSQDFPELFLEVDTILFTVSDIIWWQKTLIQYCVSVVTFLVTICDACTLIC